MKAGALRHRISVFYQSLSSDGCGGYIESYITRGNCWAEIAPFDPTSNTEQYHDRRITSVEGVRAKTRHNIGFDFLLTDVIVFKDQLYRIQGITNALDKDFKYSLFLYKIERDSVEFGFISGLFSQQGNAMYNQDGNAMYNQTGVA